MHRGVDAERNKEFWSFVQFRMNNIFVTVVQIGLVSWLHCKGLKCPNHRTFPFGTSWHIYTYTKSWHGCRWTGNENANDIAASENSLAVSYKNLIIYTPYSNPTIRYLAKCNENLCSYWNICSTFCKKTFYIE